MMLILPVGAGAAWRRKRRRWRPRRERRHPGGRTRCHQPLFVPTHPRVTTTIRFPGEIGVSDGQGFHRRSAKEITAGNGRLTSEYHIQWTQGDSYFTVVPLAGAGTRNLNVPYQGNTYVLYFYPVEKRFRPWPCSIWSRGDRIEAWDQ